MQAFFPNFRILRHRIDADTQIHAEVGGGGPPLLLLHGYPQTHAAWHRIAPALAERFTVVAPDLRGYGDSTGPQHEPGGAHYSKRVLAADKLALMRSLGFGRFAILAHDRGARVGYRLALDHPDAVACFSSLTVVPGLDVWEGAGAAFFLKAWHWAMLAQPFDLPERLLAADPAYFLDWTLQRMVQRPDALAPEALAAYHRAFARPEVRHAIAEDYRAGATLDLEHDRTDREVGRRMACPVQVLWSASLRAQATPLDIWRRWADEVQGAAVDCGHLMAEEAPQEVLAQVMPFLARHAAR